MKHKHYLFGTHACLAALANPMRKIRNVFITKQTHDDVSEKLKNIRFKPQIVESRKIDSILPSGSVHQGIAVECELLTQPSLTELLADSLKASAIIILDQVTDPHNVGAILRSAAAFEISAVIATDRHSPPETGVMAKAASGAMEIVPYITVGNLAQAIGQLKKANYWIYGMDSEAKQSLRETKLDKKTAIILGAEGKGLRRLTAENCDILLKLPISKNMESLNVSNAAAIAMYEVYSKLQSFSTN